MDPIIPGSGLVPTTSTKDSLNSNGEVYYCGNEKNPIFCPPCWYMKMNLHEALHMVELRTMPQGHPDYRFIAQEIWRRIQEVHPTLAECGMGSTPSAWAYCLSSCTSLALACESIEHRIFITSR